MTAARYKLVSLSLLLMLPIASCQKQPMDSYQRFLPVPDSGGLLALDTKTGQLCTTALHQPANLAKQYPVVPRCLDLYHAK